MDTTIEHTIKVDSFVKVSLAIPTEMDAVAFMGLLMKVKRILPPQLVQEGVLPSTRGPRGPYVRVVWTSEMDTIIRNAIKAKATSASIFDELKALAPDVTLSRVEARRQKMKYRGK